MQDVPHQNSWPVFDDRKVTSGRRVFAPTRVRPKSSWAGVNKLTVWKQHFCVAIVIDNTSLPMRSQLLTSCWAILTGQGG
jgi:hypothetical protein